MAEWLKALVLKTSVGQPTVGSNPSPSASRFQRGGFGKTKYWGGARVADWGRLLSGCRGINLDRGFESRPPRHNNFYLFARPWYPQGVWSSNPVPFGDASRPSPPPFDGAQRSGIGICNDWIAALLQQLDCIASKRVCSLLKIPRKKYRWYRARGFDPTGCSPPCH